MIDGSIKLGIYDFIKRLKITTYCYMRELPQNPSYPATVYNLTDDYTSDIHQQGPGLREAIVQIDVLAETVKAAEEAMESYYVALAGYRGSLGIAGFTDVCIYDEGMNLDEAFENESLNNKVEIRGRAFRIIY